MAGFDGLWANISQDNTRVHGVKIDVPGMENFTLTGMANALRQWRPKLVIEFHKGVNRRAILDLLEACGYNSQPEPVDISSESIEDDKSYAFVPE